MMKQINEKTIGKPVLLISPNHLEHSMNVFIMQPRFSNEEKLPKVPTALSAILLNEVLRNPTEFNKQELWSQRGTEAPAFIFSGLWPSFEKNDNTFRDCFVAVLNAKYRIAPFCNYDIMTTIYLEEVHNLTLHLINSLTVFGENYTKVIEKSPQFITKTELITTVPNSTYGFSFSGHYSEQLMYCNRVGGIKKGLLNLDYAVWTQPFSYEIWSIILPILFIGCVLCTKQKTFVVIGLTLVALITRQSIRVGNRQRKIFIVLELFTLILSIIWGNGIVSLIVAPPTPRHMETLKEFIENGFKILHPFYITNPYSKYETDFNISGIKHDTNLFQVFDEDENFFQFLSQNRVGWPLESNHMAVANQLRHVRKNSLGHKERNIDEWLILKQKLMLTISARKIQMYNTYWLLITIRRMHDTGLVHGWESMFHSYHVRLHERISKRYKAEPGVLLLPTYMIIPQLDKLIAKESLSSYFGVPVFPLLCAFWVCLNHFVLPIYSVIIAFKSEANVEFTRKCLKIWLPLKVIVNAMTLMCLNPYSNFWEYCDTTLISFCSFRIIYDLFVIGSVLDYLCLPTPQFDEMCSELIDPPPDYETATDPSRQTEFPVKVQVENPPPAYHTLYI
ncbi:unnamed protein product [Orchesella dallaii]|uniref:Uncharacterized protein n=1 Tax=Orchesella dallaii TaxID=48710 RepID=A0ABP1PZM0_9HEXA